MLAFAARDLDDATMDAAIGDPMAAVTDLVLVALVGIIDPLREEAKESVRIALRAGVDVRMITGDHTVTARAIADQLGLGPGVITGRIFRTCRTARSSSGSRSSMSSAVWRRRTRCDWLGSCRRRATWSR